ncbi:MAG TPA: trypsin-like peptidase domain-containing protein [Chitinophagaceae bacterium]|jgi:Do/DeqQ family serine protease|nr:trypsin-like peptidase domain-containing protein [Chitinophagaceae bacterium]
MKFKQVILIVAISSGSALASVWGYSKFAHKEVVAIQSDSKVPANYAGFFDGNAANAPVNIDFTQAASTSVQAVVHIKTKIAAQKVSNDLPRSNNRNRGGIDDWLDQFFDFGPQMIPEQRASGSGVLISDDGYIVTNNHVVSDQNGGVAGEIMVTLHNKKSYKARLIGKDPSSDIAVLKIDGTGFPYLVYGNSDEVKLGQWVLAIGYPLTLETTVTAGIVSAKGRSIGINERQTRGTNISPVESFIQTDAAVNQGNSGGALVTTDGKLIGINSAILAPNGTYAGYSFAVPVNIAKKIVNDIVEFGDVQRGYLGIQYASNLSESQMKELGIKENEGVYVLAVPTDGGAYAAGIKKGDIITKVNNTPVSSGIEMSAQIAGFRPNDKVQMSYLRGSKEYNTTVTLKAKVSAVEVSTAAGDIIGAELSNLDSKKAEEYDVSGGVVVKKIKEGGKLSETKMDEGFVITSVNGRTIKSIDELSKILNSAVGTVKLEGFYPGFRGSYTYPLDLTD